MTAFTASRAPETTADNNVFGGEGVRTLSTSRLRGPPSVGWISSKHKRISPRPFEQEEGAGRIELVLSGDHRKDDSRSISSERRTTILEPHNLEGLHQSEGNQGIAYVGVGAIVKIRQGRLSKVVVEKFEGRKARRKGKTEFACVGDGSTLTNLGPVGTIFTLSRIRMTYPYRF